MKYIKTLYHFLNENIDQSRFNYGNLSADEIALVDVFIEDLKSKCAEYKITLRLDNTQGVPFTDGSIMVNGYFDDVTRTLACAMGKDVSQWLIILLHESSHMDQFMEQVSAWTNNAELKETNDWLDGKDDADMEKIELEITTGIDVELDCEIRTVDKIIKFGLDKIVDTTEYIQKSNAYILFYRWMQKNRSWYTLGKEPYNIPQIVSIMPKSFDIDYTKMTKEVEDVFDKYLK